MSRAVLFDRDGVVNEQIFDQENGTVDSPMVPSQVRLVYGISELIKGVKEMGFITIICSNQPSVGLGKISPENFKKVNKQISTLLKKKGAKLDYWYFCMHHPFAKLKEYKLECVCRKPKPGMLLKAARKHNIDLSSSWMVGDGVNDVLAGKAAGCKVILLANIESVANLKILEDQLNGIKPDFVIKKLPDAIKVIR